MASTSNWILIGGLVILIAIAAYYFTSGGADGPTTTGATAPAVEAPAADAPAADTAADAPAANN